MAWNPTVVKSRIIAFPWPENLETLDYKIEYAMPWDLARDVFEDRCKELLPALQEKAV